MAAEKYLLDYVKRRLEHWAKWYTSGNHPQMGYATCSIEYRLMKEGAVAKSRGPRPLPCNLAAEEIETLVCELARYNPEIARALRSHYFPALALKKRADGLQLTSAQLNHYIELGHCWLTWQLAKNLGVITPCKGDLSWLRR